MVTIKDVARESGLAVSTVSRIMNNRGYISEEARKKVQDAMAKLNYQPNELARSLHRKNSNIIGLIVPAIDHPYFSKVILCVESAAHKYGYQILVCNTQTKQQKEQASFDVCRRNRVAGIIMCTGKLSIKGFKDMSVPAVGWERSVDSNIPSIDCDNVQGGILAAQHLIDRGSRRILYLGKNMRKEDPDPGNYRYIGFKSVCDKSQVELINRYDMLDNNIDIERDDYSDKIAEILSEDPTIDAVFADNDLLAAQVLRACAKMNRKVPEDIQVIGFDDSMISLLTAPSITTIHQPIEEMANHALYLLENMINDKAVTKRAVFPVKIIERESTLP